MTAQPVLRTPPAAMPVSRIVAAMVAMAVIAGVISTYALFALRPELFAPPGPAAPVVPAVPSDSPDVASPSPTPPPSPSASPTPTVAPTAAPSPTPSPVPAVPATPAAAPTPPGTGNVLPQCAYMDIPTPHDSYGEWPITLLDTIYHVSPLYAPSDLVDSSAAGLNSGYLVRSLIVADLAAMADEARAAGAPIQLVSGYRSYAQQEETFAHWVNVGGYEQALRTSARAGHSEHQLGTVIDVTSAGGSAPWEYADWAQTPAGAWMSANSWRYGFVLSYPAGAWDRTCYDYEPWHFRYVGRDLAERIATSGRTPREVIWELQ